MSQKIKYLSIGHCCYDKMDDQFVLGGTASYASLLANRLGADTHLLTSYGDDFLFGKDFAGADISVTNILSKETTVFQNKYEDSIRTQTLLARARSISSKDLENLSEQYDITHISPIADEVDLELLNSLDKEKLTVATPQGWLRQWDESGIVSYKPIDWNLLSEIDFVIISEEDIADFKTQLPLIKEAVKALIVTRGKDGSIIYNGKVEAHFPAYASTVVDPTGAGDTFATGFIMRYAKTGEIVDSMIYANCLASICVEYQGTTFFDHLEDIERRMSFYKKNLLNLNAAGPMRIK